MNLTTPPSPNNNIVNTVLVIPFQYLLQCGKPTHSLPRPRPLIAGPINHSLPTPSPATLPLYRPPAVTVAARPATPVFRIDFDPYVSCSPLPNDFLARQPIHGMIRRSESFYPVNTFVLISQRICRAAAWPLPASTRRAITLPLAEILEPHQSCHNY